MTLKEEVAKQIKFDFLHQDMNDSYISIAEKILKITLLLSYRIHLITEIQ